MTEQTLAQSHKAARLRAADGRSGVILMETLLVLPILLMLLGGLFVIGDLLMGRLVAHEIDRTLAWRVKERFSYVPSRPATAFDESAFSHIPGPHGIKEDPGLGLFAYEATGSGMGNLWSSVFAGRSDVQVDVPWWVNLVNVQDAVMGDPQNPDRMESSYKLNSGDNGNFMQTARAYVFRRKDNGEARSGHTSVFPWFGIVGDKMASLAVGGGLSGGRLGTYNRNPNAIIVSGDPGP